MKPWLKDIERVDDLPRTGGIDLKYCEWTEPLDKELFQKFLKTLTWEDFALYPESHVLKNALAEHYGVTPLNVYLAPGSAEAIKSVFDCMNLGESVVTTEPCFPMYDVNVKQNNLRVQKVKPRKDLGYTIETNGRTNLIVFSRPSNPTGYFFTRDDVIKILEENPDAWVLVDEAYIGYVENPDSIIDLISVYDNLVISRSFSKTHGGAGCRIGYLLSHSKNIDLIATMRQMNEVAGPSMKYALFMLKNEEEVRKYCKKTIKERKKLCSILGKAGIEYISSQGNWIHVNPTKKFFDILEKKNIFVKTGTTIPGSDVSWVRMTVGPGISKLFEELLG